MALASLFQGVLVALVLERNSECPRTIGPMGTAERQTLVHDRVRLHPPNELMRLRELYNYRSAHCTSVQHFCRRVTGGKWQRTTAAVLLLSLQVKGRTE